MVSVAVIGAFLTKLGGLLYLAEKVVKAVALVITSGSEE